MPDSINTDLALAMTGGGARAAYQVGVLRHICRHFDDFQPPILTGVSAGAINAVYLAAHPGRFEEAVDRLADLWLHLTADKVFRTDSGYFLGNFVRWGLNLVLGGKLLGGRRPSLLDNDPLRRMLERRLHAKSTDPIDGIRENLERGRLRVLAVTGTNYGTGISVTWLQGDVAEHWLRARRRSENAQITIEHVMASTALPLIFPAVRIDGGWHGDGGIRSIAPLSPAMHLGAGRIIAISTRFQDGQPRHEESVISGYVPVAQIVGILLDSVFLDLLDYDAANMNRINEVYDEISAATRTHFRQTRVLVLRPSEDLGKLAGDYEITLPQPFRYLMRGLGTRDTKSPDSLSLLMFQPDYLRYLIDLGERDARTHAELISEFLNSGKSGGAGRKIQAMK